MGQIDPYTLDDIRSKFAIRIKENGFIFCFDIRSLLLDFSINRFDDKNRYLNPLTRQRFSNQNIIKILKKFFKYINPSLNLDLITKSYSNFINAIFKKNCNEEEEKVIINLVEEFKKELNINTLKMNTYDKDRDDDTILIRACKFNKVSLIKKLLQLGFNVNDVDSKNLTALTYATIYGFDNAVIALCEDPKLDPNIVREDAPGETPLMYACWKCRALTVLKLLQKGADVNTQAETKFHYTPLMYGLYNVHGYSEAHDVLIFLLNFNADINVRDIDGDTVYEHTKTYLLVKNSKSANNLTNYNLSIYNLPSFNL